MDWLGILAWGLLATTALTIVHALGLWMGLSRMSTPVILGTMVTPDRDRAMFYGTLIHLLMGWLFALVYAAAFEAAGFATWWLGAIFGLVHELFMLGIVVPALPAIHPRMASQRQGPDPTRALQPPGFLALNYGRQTVLVGALAHALYGGILGALYQV
jgi:hypothetical protein